MNSTPEEQDSLAEELSHNIAVYSPQLDPSHDVNQYVHYVAAGVGIQTIYSVYATAEHDYIALYKRPPSPRPLMDSTQCLIMSVDATIAKAFVGAQDATTEQGIDLIFHMSSDDFVTMEVMLAQRGRKELSVA